MIRGNIMARIKYTVTDSYVRSVGEVELQLKDQQLILNLGSMVVSDDGKHITNIGIVSWLPYHRSATRFKMKKIIKKLMMQILSDSIKYANKVLEEKGKK